MKTLWKNSIHVATSIALTLGAYASDWTGGGINQPWSSNGNPGWNGTGVPNSQGAIANFPESTASGSTIADILVTVGTINYNGTGNFSRSITAVNNITLDQDGAGPGFALITNTNPNTGTTNFLGINSGMSGNFILADDLHVVNTGGGTNNSGAILLGTALQGTGNVTFSTVGNTVTSSTVYPGAIRITGNNAYTGNVLVQKGAISTNSFTAFGNAANVVTLGQAGQGSVTVMGTTNNVDLANPFVVASGTGGTTVLGTASTGVSTFSGGITLNQGLTINSFVTAANGLTLSGAISGAGGLTFTSGGTNPALIISRLTNTGNSYSGGTLINAGTLIAVGDGTLGTGNVSLIAPNVRLTLQGGAVNNYIADTASISLLSTDILNLNFTGTDTVAALIVNGVSQAPGLYNSGNLPQITGTGAISVIPEPRTNALLLLSAGVVLLVCRRKRVA